MHLHAHTHTHMHAVIEIGGSYTRIQSVADNVRLNSCSLCLAEWVCEAWLSCVAGLPGFSLMLSDIGVKEIGLHGPQSLAGYREATRVFIGRDKTKVTFQSHHADNSSVGSDDWGGVPVYRDENLTVRTLELESDEGDPGEGVRGEGARGEDECPPAKWPRAPSKRDAVTVYVCKLVDMPGKFNPQNAASLGLKPGPHYKRLCEGESVQLPDGRIIQPSDVVGPPQQGPTFIVAECPSLSLVRPLTAHPLLRKEAFEVRGEPVSLVVHLAPPEVLDHAPYVAWMTSFGPDTRHLLLGEGACPQEVCLRAILKIQCPLHLMSPAVHHAPLPGFKQDGATPPGGLRAFRELGKDALIVGENLMKYHLKPLAKSGVDRSSCLSPFEEKLAECLSGIQADEKLTSAISRHRTPTSSDVALTPPLLIPHPSTPSPLSPDDALVTFLGTASAIPSHYRNVSGTLVQTPDCGSLLLDGGEGTLTQIYRCFGREHGDEILRDLRTIFVSHVHPDHHLGVISILKRRSELLRGGGGGAERTVVVAPIFVINWLTMYSNMCEALTFDLVDCRCLVGANRAASPDSPPSSRHPSSRQPSPPHASPRRPSPPHASCRQPSPPHTSPRHPSPPHPSRRHPSPRQPSPPPAPTTFSGGLSLETVPVRHINESYGVVVRHPSGWSLVFSGDTRPCPALVRRGRGTDLLIHEATFEDDLQDEAVARNHSTFSEALGVATEMGAKFTILTHFSQRYPHVPPALLQDKRLCSHTALAFDLMSVRLSQLASLPSFLPTMTDIFAAVLDPDDDRTDNVGPLSW